MLIGGDGRVTIIDFQASRALIANEAVHLESATPDELRMEMRKVKFKLDYEGARAKEHAKSTRCAMRSRRNHEQSLTAAQNGERAPKLELDLEEDMLDPPVEAHVWNLEWMGTPDVPRRFVMPGQTAVDIEREVQKFIALVERMDQEEISLRCPVSPPTPPPDSPPSDASLAKDTVEHVPLADVAPVDSSHRKRKRATDCSSTRPFKQSRPNFGLHGSAKVSLAIPGPKAPTVSSFARPRGPSRSFGSRSRPLTKPHDIHRKAVVQSWKHKLQATSSFDCSPSMENAEVTEGPHEETKQKRKRENDDGDLDRYSISSERMSSCHGPKTPRRSPTSSSASSSQGPAQNTVSVFRDNSIAMYGTFPPHPACNVTSQPSPEPASSAQVQSSSEVRFSPPPDTHSRIERWIEGLWRLFTFN